MSEFFLPSEHTMAPGLVAVSYEAQSLTKEMLRLFRCVYLDPCAFVHFESDGTIEKRVHHAKRVGTILRAIRGKVPLPETNADHEALERDVFGAYSMYSGLGEFDQDGGAVLVVEHRTLPTIDLREDPFTEHLMDSFRSHVNNS